MILISVIVPVYNVQECLPICLRSVVKQLRDDWEVILVNDGSTDGSGRICEEFAAGKDNVRVVVKPNGGLSDARNEGIKVAKGDWIFFLDSDDWLREDAIRKLFDFAIDNKCDVVQGGIYYAYSDHLLYRKPSKNEAEITVLDNNEAMHQLILNDRVKNFAWGKLYRADLIRDLEFPVGKYFEDSYWQHNVMHKVTRYGIIDEPLYYYRQRETSISGNFSERNLDLLKGYESRMFFIKDNYPSFFSEIVCSYWNILFSFYSQSRRRPVVEKLYCEYYSESLDKYYDYFSKCLSSSFTWQFRESRIIIKIYQLISRVVSHLFCSSQYKVISNKYE